MQLSDIERQLIEQELCLVKKYAPEGALERALAATRGGAIYGRDYSCCLLGHAFYKDEDDARYYSKKIFRKLAEEEDEDGYSYLAVENLIMDVEEGETPEDSEELEELERFLLKAIETC